MVSDIESGKIGVVLCKDMSRLGRNNAMVAYYTEIFFPEYDVRFIAISDGIDTMKGENEMMAFRSVINEYYARDISKKIKAAYHTKAQNGEFIGSYAPYGYLRDPDNKNHLIVNTETAENVKSIFRWAVEGLSPYKISRRLMETEVLTPRAYLSAQTGKYKDSFFKEWMSDWSPLTVASIIKNRVYLGHIVGNKSTNKSFKIKKQIRIPESEWIETKNTHEPIIDEETFELAQKVAKTKKRDNNGKPNIFAGLIKCSDCGYSLVYVQKEYAHGGAYNCGQYRHRTRKCTAHYIPHKHLYQLVLEDIQKNAQTAKQYETKLAEYVSHLSNEDSEQKEKKLKREFEKAKQRDSELNIITKQLFEKNALGILTDEQFLSMSAEYTAEHNSLKVKIAELETELAACDDCESNTKKFLDLVRKYSDITELDVKVLNNLIDRIVIYNPETNARKNRKQKVDIYYKFVGQVNLGEEFIA